MNKRDFLKGLGLTGIVAGIGLNATSPVNAATNEQIKEWELMMRFFRAPNQCPITIEQGRKFLRWCLENKHNPANLIMVGLFIQLGVQPSKDCNFKAGIINSPEFTKLMQEYGYLLMEDRREA